MPMFILQDSIAKNPLIKKALYSFVPAKREADTVARQNTLLYFTSMENVKDHQEQKFKTLLNQAYKSPYYKMIIDSIGKPIEHITLACLKDFPLLTKNIIRNKNHELFIENAKGTYLNHSGGSTGEPISFYQDEHYYIHASAGVLVSDGMAGWEKQARTVKLWGAPEDKKKIDGIAAKAKLYLLNRKFLDTFDMSMTNIMKYHRLMERFQPEVIISYASSIYLMARFFQDNNIKPSYPKTSIISAAETLHSYMKEVIEKVFPVRIFNRYGSREISAAASECEMHEGLHVHMSDQIIEIVDQKTGANVFEEPGEIIVTNLNNYAFPFIRYNIGDIGILTERPCACGRSTQRLLKILGRTSDNFYFKNGKIIHGEYFTHLFYNRNDVEAFQLIQESHDLFRLKIVTTKYFKKDEFEQFLQILREAVGNDCEVRLECVDSIPKSKSGKYLFTVSKLDPRSTYDRF